MGDDTGICQPLAPPEKRDLPGTRPPTDLARVNYLVGAIQAQLNREREAKEKR